MLLRRVADSPHNVVVIDTIRNLRITPQDENDNSAVAHHLAPWIAMARERRKTLAMMHHMRKGAGDHGEGISGGHALFGAVDIALELRRDTKPNRRLIKAYARLIQPEDLLYEQDTAGNMIVVGNPAAVGLLEVQARVAAVLGPEWLKTAEVRELLDDPVPGAETIRNALHAAARAGMIERDPPIDAQCARGKVVRWRTTLPGSSNVFEVSVRGSG